MISNFQAMTTANKHFEDSHGVGVMITGSKLACKRAYLSSSVFSSSTCVVRNESSVFPSRSRVTQIPHQHVLARHEPAHTTINSRWSYSVCTGVLAIMIGSDEAPDPFFFLCPLGLEK